MQQGRWAHRLYLLKDRLQHQGMFPTLVIYYHRIRSMLFSRYVVYCRNIKEMSYKGNMSRE